MVRYSRLDRINYLQSGPSGMYSTYESRRGRGHKTTNIKLVPVFCFPPLHQCAAFVPAAQRIRSRCAADAGVKTTLVSM